MNDTIIKKRSKGKKQKMLGNNARGFVISPPKQPKYTSEQMSLFFYLKSGFVTITNYTNYTLISCQKIFIFVFFAFDISRDLGARTRTEHAYSGSNSTALVLLTYVSNGNKRQYLRIKFKLLYLLLVFNNTPVNGNDLQPMTLCSARLIHLSS